MNQESGQTGLFFGISIVASVLLHVLVWQVASNVHVNLIQYVEPIDRPNRPVTVRTVDLNKVEQPDPKAPESVKKEMFDAQESQLHSLFQREKLIEKTKPELKPRLTGLGRNVLKKAVDVPKNGPADTGVGDSMLSTPPPSLVAIDARDEPAHVTSSERRTIPDIERKALGASALSSIASSRPGTGIGHPETVNLSMRMKLPMRRPSDLPPPVRRQAENGDEGQGDNEESKPVLPPQVKPPRQQAEPEPISAPANVLDSLMKVDVSVHWEERAGGDGYFSVEISPNEAADRLVTIPKDILLLVDASASIGFLKLRRFKEGLSLALDYMQPEDRFNVVAFRDNPTPLFPGMREVSPANLAAAREFVDDLRSKGRTDVYGGVAPFVTEKRSDPTRPYLVFLMSDGRSTTGNELANNEFIKRVTQQNRSNASIFSFSAGDNTNLFLMDYLSYKNRGFSVHTDELDTVAPKLAQYVGGLTDVIVYDVSCRITGNLQGDIYPRELPHLFRGHPLTVYGKVPAGTERIGIQVKGRNRQGQEEELVLAFNLKDAQKVGPELATQWAAQKIYYMISEWTIRNDEKTWKDIQKLADQYNILVPY